MNHKQKWFLLYTLAVLATFVAGYQLWVKDGG
jgi:hypothetical protein